jgi:PPIC-type PPIASE domain
MDPTTSHEVEMTASFLRCAFVAAATCGLAASACDKRPPPAPPAPAAAAATKTAWGETPLARVGDGVITLERFRRRRAQAPGRDPAALLEDLIREEVLVQDAIREGALARDSDVRDRLIADLVAAHAQELRPVPPTPEILRAFHAAHRAELPDEELLHVSQLLIKVHDGAPPKVVQAARDRAERLRREALRKPDAFADLVRRESQDPTAARGGDLGFLPYARLTLLLGDEFAAVVTRVPPGGIGDVVRSRQGFHVFRVIERSTPGDADPLPARAAELSNRYELVTARELRQKFADQRRGHYTITIDRAALERAR